MLRMILVPLIALGTVSILGLECLESSVVVLVSAMPKATPTARDMVLEQRAFYTPPIKGRTLSILKNTRNLSSPGGVGYCLREITLMSSLFSSSRTLLK
jgi:hypothetical protein